MRHRSGISDTTGDWHKSLLAGTSALALISLITPATAQEVIDGDTVVVVDGDGSGDRRSPWNVGGDLLLGQSLGADPLLVIQNGGHVVNQLGSVGDREDAAGSVIVTGDGSAWQNTSALFVGGLTIGNTPLSDPAAYELHAGGGHVDLFIAPPGEPGDDTLQHWQGGDGVWNDAGAQWLNRDGNMAVAWAGNHAVFRNQPGGFAGGIVEVEGDQTFRRLQFVNEGYRLEGTGALVTHADGSEIRALADATEISTTITGTGGVSITGGGTLILSGNNSHEGGTSISGGTTLFVSSDANLGHADGALTFSRGTLATTASFDSDREIMLNNHGWFDIADATILGLDGDISGSGNLFMAGEGTLVLTGTNAYGDTIVLSGTLEGDAGSISGHIANAGTVIFDQTTNGIFAGDIAALNTAGDMILRGGAALTLGGYSTLDWTIEDGTLAAAAARFAGDVLLDGAGTSLVVRRQMLWPRPAF